MSMTKSTPQKNFSEEFLRHYLKGGIGSMPKSDIDALVMHLLDKYSGENGSALGIFSNQIASERLRAPLSKIKRLRYEGSLKFGGRPEEEARTRFVRIIERAGLEFDKKDGKSNKIVFVVEDVLAKNWIQGQIKECSGVYDGSFNTEIVKVEPEMFFALLRKLFPACDINEFESRYTALKAKKTREEIISGFKTLLASFAKGAAQVVGTHVAATLLPLPPIGA